MSVVDWRMSEARSAARRQSCVDTKRGGCIAMNDFECMVYIYSSVAGANTRLISTRLPRLS